MALALTNPARQTVAVGQAVIFNTLADQSCCNKCRSCNGVCWRRGTGSIKLCKHCKQYEVTFHANVSGTAGTEIALAVAIGGEVIPYSRMVYTPAGTEFGSLAITIPIYNCCCDYDRITIVNVGTTEVTVGMNPLIAVSLGEEA